MVGYQWSGDGEIEYGEVDKEISTEIINCYHCRNDIAPNETVNVFRCQDGDVYRICNECARDNIIEYI